LPGLCILKLIAFDEKPDWRFKDFEDYSLMMRNYGEIASEELFSGPYEDLVQGDFEISIAGARMLGRNMQTILNKNEILKKRITAILKN
jgi:predicted nucleotidyltransferase